MLDLLAAIVSADPPALLAWLVLAFAAGMYPVGIMLGSSCSACCGQSAPCTLCTEGELPETLTVTFSGLADRTPGPDLCALTFSAPYGSGAAGKVTAPGGDPATNKGPISSVSLTNGGSGYAKLGRVAPTITASGGTGTGATFAVNKTSSNDANGIPSWSVTGVTWTGSTSGYVDGDQITFDVAAGDTAEQGAAATIHTVRTAPTVTAGVSGGTGATLSVTTATNGTTPQTWSVTGVTVTNGGTGYPASGYVTFNTASGDTAEQSADATFYSGRVAPTVTASVSGSGSGAGVSVSLASTTGYDGRTYWYVNGISITNGGTGYAEYDPVGVTVTDGEGYGAYAEVSSVDGSGAITGIAVYWGGEYFKSNGIIQSVEFGYGGGGIYYRDAGEISSISVEAAGKYYREDASLSPYVATVTVGINQTAPSNGTGATLTATVESSTSSANFGKITGVTIGSGGSGYLAHELFDTCMTRFDGRSIVVRRVESNPCLYAFSCAWDRECGLEQELVFVEYHGPTQPLTVEMGLLRPTGERTEGQRIWSLVENPSMTADELSPDCSAIDVTATGGFGVPEGATAHVAGGGEYEQAEACLAFSAEEVASVSVEATWGDFAVDGHGFYCGRDARVETICDGSHSFVEGQDEFQIAASVVTAVVGCEWRWSQATNDGCGNVPAVWLFKRRAMPFYFRDCIWVYPIISVPVDEDGFPSGAAILGQPTFSTVANAELNPDPFPANEVCENLGTPSVTFSRLP